MSHMRQFGVSMNNYEDFFLLKDLEQSQKEKIISKFNDFSSFKKGELIYSTVKFSKAIGYILEGSAYAVANNENDLYMNKFQKGMCFGAAAIFGNSQNYASTVIAASDITILFITEEKLKEIFLEYPQTALNYINFLSERIRFLNTKLSFISCSSAEDTVLKYLTCVTNETGYANIPGSMTLLAKMLGLGRASLYRSLEALENSGRIIRENNNIKVIKNEKTN